MYKKFKVRANMEMKVSLWGGGIGESRGVCRLGKSEGYVQCSDGENRGVWRMKALGGQMGMYSGGVWEGRGVCIVEVFGRAEWYV